MSDIWMKPGTTAIITVTQQSRTEPPIRQNISQRVVVEWVEATPSYLRSVVLGMDYQLLEYFGCVLPDRQWTCEALP